MTLDKGKMVSLLFWFFSQLNSHYHLVSYHGLPYPSVAAARSPGALLTGD